MRRMLVVALILAGCSTDPVAPVTVREPCRPETASECLDIADTVRVAGTGDTLTVAGDSAHVWYSPFDLDGSPTIWLRRAGTITLDGSTLRIPTQRWEWVFAFVYR